MSEKENPWFSPDRPSALIPPPTTAGSPLLHPPDPPDPPFATHFPSLQQTLASPPLSKKQISRALGTASLPKVDCSPTTPFASPAQDPFTTEAVPVTTSDLILPASTGTTHDQFKGFTVHIPKNSIPLPSSSTSSSRNHQKTPPQTKRKEPLNYLPIPQQNTQSKSPPPQTSVPPPHKPQTYAQKAKPIANKSLQRLAPITYSEAGIPQVTVPDEVFQRGAEIHKDFIQGHFFAKMPTYQAIQSVLNFMWGKGTKLDIRTNLKDRSILVRIPNEYIRSKVLEKRIWYVGTSMFHVSKWCSTNTSAAPLSVPTSIPLWAHLKGLPLDLRSLEGLSFAAGLIGEPKETDEFTRNLTDLDLAHVKIEADFSKPLPELIELRRTNGEIIPVEVTYPWVPPTCSNCRELGHIMKDCLHANPTWVEKEKSAPTVPEVPKDVDKNNNSNDAAVSDNSGTAEAAIKTLPTATEPPLADPVDLSFEKDLQEILSPSLPSSSHPAISPDPFLPSTSILPEPSDSVPFVTISSNPDRRTIPFKPKSSLKRPSPLSPPALTIFNPFTLLDAPHNKSIKLTETSDPSNLSKFPFSAFSPSPTKVPPPPNLPSLPLPLLLSSTADELSLPSEEASHQSL